MIEYSEPFQLPQSPTAVMKSTLVSIVPFEIREHKPGLIPGEFHLEASTDGRPRCTVIGESLHYVYIDKDRGSLRVLNPSYQVARSVVSDYVSCQLAAAPECHPGLFWLPGEWTPELIETREVEKLAKARRIQHDWFIELIKLADDDWEKTRQHYFISDSQRYAARAIDPENKRNRPWIMVRPEDTVNVDPVKTTTCPACGSDIPENVVVCRYCHAIIDPVRYKAMSFASSVLTSK